MEEGKEELAVFDIEIEIKMHSAKLNKVQSK